MLNGHRFTREAMISHMQGLTRAIGRVLVNAGISAKLIRAKQGPMTLTFCIYLIDPTLTQLNAVSNMGSLLSQYTGVGPVRVSTDAGSVVIEFPSPAPMTPSAYMLATHGQGKNIAIGFDHWADPVYFNLGRSNLLVIGPPMSGKSSAMRSILYQIIKDSKGTVQYIIIAERAITWALFQNIAGCVDVHLTADAGAKALTELSVQMEEKANREEQFSPPLVVILDDLISLLQANSGIGELVKRLATAGGQIGIHLIMGTQSAGSNASTGGQIVDDTFMTRLVFKTQNAGAAYRATGASNQGVEDLTTAPGDALFISGHTKVRIATGYVTNEHILEDLPKYRGEMMKTQPHPTRNSAVSVSTEILVSLPRIKPARAPTEEETAKILAYLSQNKVSQNRLLLTIYNGKNGGYRAYLSEALGAVWDSLKNS